MCEHVFSVCVLQCLLFSVFELLSVLFLFLHARSTWPFFPQLWQSISLHQHADTRSRFITAKTWALCICIWCGQCGPDVPSSSPLLLYPYPIQVICITIITLSYRPVSTLLSVCFPSDNKILLLNNMCKFWECEICEILYMHIYCKDHISQQMDYGCKRSGHIKCYMHK